MLSYARKGFLTQDEANQVRKINQIYQELQNQKTLVDNDLWDEMMKHLAKMIVKEISNISQPFPAFFNTL